MEEDDEEQELADEGAGGAEDEEEVDEDDDDEEEYLADIAALRQKEMEAAGTAQSSGINDKAPLAVRGAHYGALIKTALAGRTAGSFREVQGRQALAGDPGFRASGPTTVLFLTPNCRCYCVIEFQMTTEILMLGVLLPLTGLCFRRIERKSHLRTTPSARQSCEHSTAHIPPS